MLRVRSAGRSTAVAMAVSVTVTGALAGCGDDDDAVSPIELVDGVEVEVDSLDNTFRPADLEVAAGTEVVWRNRGRNDHNILPVDGDGWGAEVEDFGPGDLYRHRFTEPGTYPYYCSLHGTTTRGMVGTVVVTG